jgi:ferredoxin-nitrite reductase
VTTRANLQIREIAPENGVPLLEALRDIGLSAKGAGADNIRNVTGSPSAGIDPLELIDTRPLARAWQFHILEDRSLFGLPRKFNVAFDGGGLIPVLEETNDIGFQAVNVLPGSAVEPGIWMRLVLGGITGHKDLARDTGVIVKPADCVAVADAIVRVFTDHGDRTDRKKARFKYVLDAFGLDKVLKLTEEKLGRPLTRIEPAFLAPRAATDRTAHLGTWRQKQAGKVWMGVLTPVGRLEPEQMRGLAAIARRFGDGDIRLTVWQNLILSGIDAAAAPQVEAALQALGLTSKPTPIRAGLVACTGATGCKFANAHTKEDALKIADYLEARLALDTPVNIHLTGCPHSCAQHYIGDIGLVGVKVPEGDDLVMGYDIVIGGGFAEDAAIAREVWKGVKADAAPALLERLLSGYLAKRSGPGETFLAFARRTDSAALKALADARETVAG